MALGFAPWAANGETNIPDQNTGRTVEPDFLKKLVVTATRVSEEAINLPVSVEVLNREDFAPQIRYAVDALEPLVGIRTDNRPGETLFSGFEIRGLATNDTSGSNALTLVDGIPQRRLSFGGPYFGTLPFAAVDRMELVKGPIGSIYGRGALAGALQLFTNPGTPEWQVNTSASYRSDLESFFGSVQATGPLAGIPGGTMSFTASGKEAQGWQPRTESQMQNYHLHFFIPIGEDDTLRVTAGWHDGRDNNASPVPISANGERLLGRGANLSIPDRNYLDMQEFRASAAWEHQFDETFQSTLSIGYWSGDTEMFLGRPTDGLAPGSTVLNRLTQERFWEEDSLIGQLELQKTVDLGGDVEAVFTAGSSVEYLTWDNTSRGVRLPGTTFGQGVPLDLATMAEPDPSTYIFGPWGTRDTWEVNYGGFARSQIDFGDEVTAFAGIRYDTYKRHQENLNSGARSTVSDSAFSPSVGVLWHAWDSDGITVNPYFSWGRSFAPIFRAVGNTEILEIDPERSESFEAGVKTEFDDGKIQFEAAVYQIERQDIVAMNPVTTNFGNFGTWRIRGVEGSVAWQPVEALRCYANYTYRQPIVQDNPADAATNGTDIPMVPRSIAKIGFEYTASDRWSFGGGGAYFGDSFNTRLNTVEVPDYFLVDAHVSYQWENYQITAFVTNLLDQEYASSFFANNNGAAFEGLPRGFGLRFEASF